MQIYTSKTFQIKVAPLGISILSHLYISCSVLEKNDGKNFHLHVK